MKKITVKGKRNMLMKSKSKSKNFIKKKLSLIRKNKKLGQKKIKLFTPCDQRPRRTKNKIRKPCGVTSF